MMQIVYFSRKDQFLTEMQGVSGEKVYITPSPAKADGLRTLLLEATASDVITIAKFTAELIKNLWPAEEAPEVKRKADLLLIFGILKNRYLPDLGFEQFTQAYNLFSDLRSFTLNEDALSSVMEEQSPEVREAVTLFWRLLEVTGYLDEHGAYHKISEALRSADEITDLKKTFIFWGFQHLNGQQVDLLKALAIRYKVIIPFPKELKSKLKKSDWLSWLRDSKAHELDLDTIAQEPRGEWLIVNSREIALNLKNELKSGDQVILGVSKLSPLHLNIIPSQNVSYKIPHQLIDAELKELASELKQLMPTGSLLSTLEETLLSRTNLLLKTKPSEFSFKKLKALELYRSALSLIRELTDEEVKVDGFFLKLLHQVVGLNQPRTSFVPLSSQKFEIDLTDMSSLEHVERSRRVIICVDDRFDEIQSLGQNYTESIQRALSALGPLKRSELELLFKQWEFHDLFSQGQVLVLMSEATLKHSLVWKRLFNSINLTKVTKKTVSLERKLKDHFASLDKKTFSGSFSASKFQTFLDCPRKFYFNYVDKVFPSIALENDFDSLISGTITHRIIEVFHKAHMNEEELPSLTKKIMQQFIEERKISLTREAYLQHELIFNHRALNGIHFLKKLESLMSSPVTWLMEEEFSFSEEYKLTGKIDCLGHSGNVLLLLDFKSTKYGASSNKEVEELESLQLWAYAKAASRSVESFSQKQIVMGFISLDNPVESNLMFSDKELFEKVKAAKICKQHLFKNEFSEIFRAAQEKMVTVALNIQSERQFPARPRKENACRYCELTKVCIKSEAIDG